MVIDSLVSRGEFFTAYTPYQPEIAQGTLQSIFEFQTMICELTGMDVANASIYEGSTGSAESLMMAARLTGRRKSVIATSVHPEYREVIATYARHQGMPLSTVGYLKNGRVDVEALDQAIDSKPPASSSSRPISSAPSKTLPPSPTSSTRRAHCWLSRSRKPSRWAS